MKKHFTLIAISFLMITQIFSQTWDYVNSTGTEFIIYGMSFPPDQSKVGYACGMELTYNADGVVVKTTDNGANWEQILPAEGEDPINGLQGIWFINENIGFAAGWNNYFIKTIDGGASWTNVSCGSNIWYYTDVVFWDDDNGVASGYTNPVGPAVFVTNDGGDTWVTASSGVVTTKIMSLSYADATTVYAVDLDGNVHTSTDGGYNWTIKSTIDAMLFGVDFANTEFAVVGGEEEMFASNDGGRTWTGYYTGWENFYAVKAMPNGTAYVGGTDENIYKTTDFGASWEFQHNGPGTSTLYKIRETSDGTLFACGSQGTIITATPLSANFTSDIENVCQGGSVNFTAESIIATSWEWTFEGGTPATSTEQNPSVVYNTPGIYDVELTTYDDEDSEETLLVSDMITVVSATTQANTPIGEISVCTGNSIDYSTDEVEYANSYVWEVLPGAAGIISGDGLIASFNASDSWTGDYTIKVRAINICGEGEWSSELECELSPSPVQFNLSEGGTYCDGDNGIEITLDGSEIGVEYTLYNNGSQSGNTMGTGDQISFGFYTEVGDYYAEAFAGNCTETMIGNAIISIDYLPATAGTPQGDQSICGEETSEYSIEEVEGANTILWTISPGQAGTISGDNLVGTIIWTGNYEGEVEISAKGQNDCGIGSSEEALNVLVYTEPTPVIEGTQLVCQFDEGIYTVAFNEFSNYIWAVDGGDITSGQGTNEIAVLWSADQGSTTYVDLFESKMDGCSVDAQTFEVVIDNCVGVKEIYHYNITVYPNPANRNLNISLNNINASNIEILLINPEGKTMIVNNEEISNASLNTRMNINSLSQGIYYLVIKSNDNIIAREKVVIFK